MFERISRSWKLVGHSWQILLEDRHLLVFPAISGVATVATLASFLVPIGIALARQGGDQPNVPPWMYAVGFLFYMLTFFIAYYFNVAVMHCAALRMDGRAPTLSDGFRGANSHALDILGWAAISATVGIILRTIEQRLGLVGRIVIGLIGCAWAVVTYFAVPVLVFERVSAGDAVRRSAALLKNTWGDAMVVNAGTNVVFGLLALLGVVPVVIGGWLAGSGAPLPIALGVCSLTVFYWLFLGVVASALRSIFQVALYRYATTGLAPAGYPQDLLESQFIAKRRRGFFGR
ncbi:MAG: DUF6159 family protein [Polyangia bacterium]